MLQRIGSMLVLLVSSGFAQDWARQFPALVPPGAYATRMAFDAGRSTMVLFGGYASTASWPPPQTLQQTWALQGNVWSQRAPAASPPARAQHVMVYSAAMQAVVLFGGVDTNGSPLNDVWWYDGVNWNTVYYSLAPASRANPAAVADDGGLVIFGGFQPPSTYLGDLWGWSLTSGWSQGVGGPPARRNAAMARFQTPSGQLSGFVLHGGRNAAVPNLADTWVLPTNGFAWQLLPNAGGPAREEHGMVYDPRSGSAFLCSGHYVPTPSGFADDLWRFDGSTWTEVPTATRPVETIGAAIAMDTTRNRLVLFGGGTGAGLSAVSNQHWEFAPPLVTQYFGANCLPPGLVATFSATFAGRGQPWTLSIGSFPASALTFAVVAIGFGSSTWNGVPLPLPLGAIGLPACQLLVEPVATPLMPIVPVFLGGYGSVAIAIPNVPNLYGIDLYAQAIGGNATGLNMASRAARTQIW